MANKNIARKIAELEAEESRLVERLQEADKRLKNYGPIARTQMPGKKTQFDTIDLQEWDRLNEEKNEAERLLKQVRDKLDEYRERSR